MEIKTQSIKEILEVKTFDEAETLWEFCFDDLRAKERIMNIEDEDEISQFVFEIQSFNEKLLQINKTNPNHMGLTRYWIKNPLLVFNVCKKYHLSKGVVMKDNHLSFFLNEYGLWFYMNF